LDPEQSWRIFGVASHGAGCGAGGYYALAHRGTAWIEAESGLSLSSRHGAQLDAKSLGSATTEQALWSNGCADFAEGGPSARPPSCAFAKARDDSLLLEVLPVLAALRRRRRRSRGCAATSPRPDPNVAPALRVPAAIRTVITPHCRGRTSVPQHSTRPSGPIPQVVP
jgi:hypothetical protein